MDEEMILNTLNGHRSSDEGGYQSTDEIITFLEFPPRVAFRQRYPPFCRVKSYHYDEHTQRKFLLDATVLGVGVNAESIDRNKLIYKIHIDLEDNFGFIQNSITTFQTEERLRFSPFTPVYVRDMDGEIKEGLVMSKTREIIFPSAEGLINSNGDVGILPYVVQTTNHLGEMILCQLSSSYLSIRLVGSSPPTHWAMATKTTQQAALTATMTMQPEGPLKLLNSNPMSKVEYFIENNDKVATTKTGRMGGILQLPQVVSSQLPSSSSRNDYDGPRSRDAARVPPPSGPYDISKKYVLPLKFGVNFIHEALMGSDGTVLRQIGSKFNCDLQLHGYGSSQGCVPKSEALYVEVRGHSCDSRGIGDCCKEVEKILWNSCDVGLRGNLIYRLAISNRPDLIQEKGIVKSETDPNHPGLTEFMTLVRIGPQSSKGVVGLDDAKRCLERLGGCFRSCHLNLQIERSAQHPDVPPHLFVSSPNYNDLRMFCGKLHRKEI